jgi:hypothetical protein
MPFLNRTMIDTSKRAAARQRRLAIASLLKNDRLSQIAASARVSVAGSRFTFANQRLVLLGMRCGNAINIAEMDSAFARPLTKSIFPVSSIPSIGYMFAAIEFISVLRAYITSVGEAGFGSWPNTTELVIKATARKPPPIDNFVVDIGGSLQLWGIQRPVCVCGVTNHAPLTF